MKRVITFGTFDVFHLGHLNILQRAAGYGDYLVVGVSTDRLNFSKKGRNPVYTQDERSAIVRSLRCVDEVFLFVYFVFYTINFDCYHRDAPLELV